MVMPSLGRSPAGGKPKLLDQVRAVLRLKHYSLRTEESYVDWIKRFILFHGKRHPKEMAEAEIVMFLSHLATERQVAASTQNQALSALLFLSKEVLQMPEVGFVQGFERATRLPAGAGRFYQGGDAAGARQGAARLSFNGRTPLWEWTAPHGMCAVAGQRPRFRLQPDHHPGWQGTEGSGDDASSTGEWMGGEKGVKHCS